MIRAVEPKTLPGFSAVILDLDGLVIDSEPTYQSAWRRAGRYLGFPLREELVRGFHGKSYDLIEQCLISEFGPGFPLDRFREKSTEFWSETIECTGIPVKPGVHALLQDLEHYRIPFCLATNSEELYAEKCLKYAGLAQAFPKRITRERVAAPKPAPDIYLAAARLLAARPDHCLVLEDSETGVRAALNANTVAMLVANPGDLPEAVLTQVFAVFESLDDFRRLLEDDRLRK